MSWVEARSRCSVRSQFEILRTEVKEAIKERNKTLQDSTAFSVGADQPVIFVVLRRSPEAAVQFTQQETCIGIRDSVIKREAIVHVVFGLDERCYLRWRNSIECDPLEKDLTPPQVVRLALEGLFFEGHPT